MPDVNPPLLIDDNCQFSTFFSPWDLGVDTSLPVSVMAQIYKVNNVGFDPGTANRFIKIAFWGKILTWTMSLSTQG